MDVDLLRGTLWATNRKEVGGNNRSVMPLDVLGRTRATLTHTASTLQLREAAANQQYAS
jgi:hypothetical protein